MNLKATPTFQAGNFARLEAFIVPKLIAGITNGTRATFNISQGLVHVRSGELKSSGSFTVEWIGTKVNGIITYTAAHAAYNEFGTGRRGQASPGAGPYSYRQDWPGMAAIPFLRPALDAGRSEIISAVTTALGL